MCQILQRLDNAFVFYNSFCKVCKDEENIKKKPQTLTTSILEMAGVIYFKFGM